MSRVLLATVTALLAAGSALAQPAPPTLAEIMADPDWIAAMIELPELFMPHAVAPYFSVDGQTVYYRVKRAGSSVRDLHRIDLASGEDRVVDAAAMAEADGCQTVYDASGTRAAFVRNGDIFVRELAGGALRQITRTPQEETAPQFSPDGRRLSFRVGTDWFVHDLATGVTAPAALLKPEKDPDAPPAADDLRELQLRLFSTLRKQDADKQAAREEAQARQRADATRAPLPFWLGDEVKLVRTALSPDTRWLLAVTQPKNFDEGRKGKLTRFVTESGYEEFEDERVRVGRNPPAPQTLWLADLAAHTLTRLDYAPLPGLGDDPLEAVREENERAGLTRKPEAKDAAAKKTRPAARELEVADIAFARDGAHAAVLLRARDNKDRWIASVDPARKALVPQHRLHDDAWINWNFNEFGWRDDARTLWYVSEESGFAHLYTKPLDGRAQALTHGRFEVSQPQLSADGRWFYLRANAEAPYAYDVYRVPAGGGALERVTRYGGVEDFALAHDGTRLLVAHSASYVPPQLALVAADGSGAPRELTDTRTPRYRALTWIAPEFVEVPSTHFRGTIHAKLYRPENVDNSTMHPAVLFVHGAGYTQNVHRKFPYYFREQMFHNLLVRRGYLVLDMDYRASEGYGRDWRVAIYRQMGHPELEDLQDGKRWLTERWHVDPARVGIYGGSYGGFLTLMALFRAPGEFAAGAALRPVTDWTQYDDEYTSDILNRPQLDPLAYRRSSPIEFAEGLRDPLLICHGMIDNNVLFEDSVRLYQRLIELHKDDFWIAPYPLDRHGFVNADSWLDEYKRIDRLFETHLR